MMTINDKYRFLRYGNPPQAEVKSSSGVIMQLAKEFADRSRADIQKWRQAIQAADSETPRWVLLQDLYDNLSTDGHLSSVLAIRKAATLSKRFYIQDKSGQEQPEKTELLQTEWFYHLMEHLLDTPFRGYTVMELTDPATYRFELIPRRNCVPQNKMILFEAMGDKGITYTDPAFARNIFDLQSINLFGLLNNIVPQLIWKRNAQQVWADFSEKFGIPLITATTIKTSKKDLDHIENMLRQLGQAAQAVFPEGTTIDIKGDTIKGDPHKVFLEQIKLANDEISKPFVGGTMVNEEGSSRSQSEVHERTLDDKISESDRRMIEFTVNGKIIPILSQWGLKFTEGDRFVFDRTEDLSMTQHWAIVSGAIDRGYNIPEDWVSSRFNIPIEGKRQPQTLPAAKAAFTQNFR
jgi:hypothetical protein